MTQAVARQSAWLRAEPRPDAETVSEVLLGETLSVKERRGDWVRATLDGYPGWLAAHVPVAPVPLPVRVTALRAHLYAAPDVAAPVLARLSLGCRLALAGETHREEGRVWERVSAPQPGWVPRAAFAPLPPLLTLAPMFVGTPYRWGGRSAWGVDCSGLVGLLYAQYGVTLPRDSGPQRLALSPVTVPQAGDLAFFPGHVGLMLDGQRLLNATSYHMAVAVDTLGEGEYGQMLARDLLGYGRPL